MTKPILDQFGRVVEEPLDHWEQRSGIALALQKLAAYYDESMVLKIAAFLVPKALDDRNEIVRNHVLDAAVTIVNIHGKVASALPFLDAATHVVSFFWRA